MFTGYLQRLAMERDPWMVLEHVLNKALWTQLFIIHPNGIISNTEELMQYMSELSNICTLSYNFWRNHYTAKTTDAFFSILAQST